jgi:hypothetical protein
MESERVKGFLVDALAYSARDQKQNEAVALKQFLEKSPGYHN